MPNFLDLASLTEVMQGHKLDQFRQAFFPKLAAAMPERPPTKVPTPIIATNGDRNRLINMLKLRRGITWTVR